VIGSYIAEHGGRWLILVLGFALMLGGPVGLLVLFVHLVGRRAVGPRSGILFGVAVATWASISELFVPYCGLYPCLPGLAVAERLGVEAHWQLEVVLHAVNFTLWPAIGWLAFSLLARFVPRPKS
jgi:hypothetical protein